MNTNVSSSIIEVDNEGEIVWDMTFFEDENYYSLYSTDRFNFSPYILNNTKINTHYLTNSSVNITWETCYNFKNRVDINGSYQILLNDSIVDSDYHTFKKWRQSSSLNYDFGKLSKVIIMSTFFIQ